MIGEGLLQELWLSTELLFQSRLTWLFLLGPLALFGDATGIFGEALCFAFSGIALIPCAERLSFVTEQVAYHTNGTIGALLNATFGNAPELLISTAALRAGFYRVVQLAMLGSMLTNLLFVFGVSCLVGGMRWQVQELRITSGNVSVGLLLVATAGALLPAALALSGEMRNVENTSEGVPSESELKFCRINAVVMMFMYLCYLLFQLGTHKEEFDEEENIVETPQHLLLMTPHFNTRQGNNRKARAKRNAFFLRYLFSSYNTIDDAAVGALTADIGDVELDVLGNGMTTLGNSSESRDELIHEDSSLSSAESLKSQSNGWINSNTSNMENRSLTGSDTSISQRRRPRFASNGTRACVAADFVEISQNKINDDDLHVQRVAKCQERHMSLRVGIIWLFIITLCISAMSDIMVDTIDGFAYRCHLSEVFTSMVIVPFFSNVAEQVSAILFAYRNEMDLCVGVTVGSAIQIATFVLPGCVVIGMFVDRSMTLYFRGYETCCLFLGVIATAAVLQGGTTNWLVGITLISIYTMIAAGFWFHEFEDLSIDAELLFQNKTAEY